jgi:hypothetical protein
VADHTPEQVDRVAQAIADEGWYLGFWRDEADDHQRNRYRRMARAALDALQLTEERRTPAVPIR